MSKRLTKQDRQNIIEKILTEAYKDRAAKLQKKAVALGDAIYAYYMNGTEEIVDSLPSGFFFTHGAITVEAKDTKGNRSSRYHICQVALQGWRAPREFREYVTKVDIPLSKTRRIPHELHYGHITLIATSGLGKRLLKLNDEWQRLHDDLRTLRVTINTALQSCTTVRRLVDNYPELAKYAPSDVKEGNQLVVPHGKIKDLMNCTKKGTCHE